MREKPVNLYFLQRWVKTYVTLVFIALTFTSLYGQDKPTLKSFRVKNMEQLSEVVDQWYEGEVTFWSGRTLLCQLSYSPLVPEGLVKVADGDLTRVLTVYDIESFSFYNHDTYTDHTYYSLPLINNRPMFVELLYEDCFYAILGSRSIVAEITNYVPGPGGAMSRSYEYVNMSYAHAYQANAASATKFIMDYRWFLVDVENHQAHDFNLNALDDQRKELRKFVRANKLQFDTVEDYIAVVQKYEDLTMRSCKDLP